MKIKKIIFAIVLSLICIEKGNTEINDALFMTVGNKPITKSDVVDEIKILLILNNESYADHKREKLHEILINNDEIKNAWEYNNLYIITDDQHKQKSFQDLFPGIKKIQNLDKYSSDVVQKLSKDELKKIITESKLISK